MARALNRLISRMRSLTPRRIGIGLMLAGIIGLLTTPATLAQPGGRTAEYLFWAVFLVFALALVERWWRWCAVVVLLSALWLASDDHWRGVVHMNEFCKMKEEILIRMHEREIKDLRAKLAQEGAQESLPSTQPMQDGR